MKLIIKPESFISHFVPGFSIFIYAFFLLYNWDFIQILNELKQKSEFLLFIGFGLLVIPYSFGLFLNEDKVTPNMNCNDELEFYTNRDIKEGEELFANYDEIESKL